MSKMPITINCNNYISQGIITHKLGRKKFIKTNQQHTDSHWIEIVE